MSRPSPLLTVALLTACSLLGPASGELSSKFKRCRSQETLTYPLICFSYMLQIRQCINPPGLWLPPELPPGPLLPPELSQGLPSLPPEGPPPETELTLRMPPGMSLTPGLYPRPPMPERLMSIVRLHKTQYTVSEDVNTFLVCAGLLRRSLGAIWVSAAIKIRDITATAGEGT